MTREKLCAISPGGISLLRLIQGLLVRMPIPHLAAFPSYGRNREGRGKRRKIDRDTKREREREGGRAGEWNRGKRGEFNMRQHRNVSNIRQSSSSSSLIPKISSRYAHIGDIRSCTHSPASCETAPVALWWQSFPSGKHQSAEMDRASRTARRTKHARKLTLIEEKGNGRDVRIERVVFDNVRRILV